MPRTARLYIEEGVFHILTRGNNRQTVFKDESDFKVYNALLQELKEEQPFKLYHYCLMSNHVHLILETIHETELSKLMKRLNLAYYHRYKRRYGYSGYFWQDRFKSLLIARDEYLLVCGLYIERNPVRAKMVSSASEYPYSSYNYYAYGKEDVLLDTDPYYSQLGRNAQEKQNVYRRLMLNEQLRISPGTLNQLFLGTKEFIAEMEGKFKMSNLRLTRGRPKQEK